MKNGEKATIREVYQLIDERMKGVSDTMNRLEKKFDDLEAGRLSSLETKFADLQGRLAVIAGVVSVIISVAIAVLNHFL